MTQLEALKIAHNELSNMMPYDDENNEIFEAAEIIQKMIYLMIYSLVFFYLLNSNNNKIKK